MEEDVWCGTAWFLDALGGSVKDCKGMACLPCEPPVPPAPPFVLCEPAPSFSPAQRGGTLACAVVVLRSWGCECAESLVPWATKMTTWRPASHPVCGEALV